MCICVSCCHCRKPTASKASEVGQHSHLVHTQAVELVSCDTHVYTPEWVLCCILSSYIPEWDGCAGCCHCRKPTASQACAVRQHHTHMLVHRAAASTTFYIHAYLHVYLTLIMHHQPAFACMLSYFVSWHTFSCVDAAPLVLGVS